MARRRRLPGAGPGSDPFRPAVHLEERLPDLRLVVPFAAQLEEWGALRERNAGDGFLAIREAVSLGLALPGLRAFWPFSSRDENDAVQDLSGQGRHLTDNGGAYGLANFVTAVTLDGSADYLSRADEAGLKWSGLTAGLSILAWVQKDVTTGNRPVVSKGDAAVQLEYLLEVDAATGLVTFQCGDQSLTSSAAAAAEGTAWHFVAGTFDGSTGFAVQVDGVRETDTTAAASLTSTADPFYIGRADDTADRYWAGSLALVALCAGELSGECLDLFYEGTRRLFGR